MLVTVQGQSKRREYVYGNPHDSRLLTGIIDERGIRYATWTYDEQGRATSSEHSKGVGKTSIDYHVDGSTTVTNELGKKTKYQFEIVQGIKRITSVVGLTTANCPNSNSTFTYDSNGLLKTKTDNKGNVTIYTYDDRGLEIHRTEASGTSVSRTIETEWHPAFSLPVQITETNRKTRYTYDKQGRQISKTVTSR
jgi:YD repeat-containing protein